MAANGGIEAPRRGRGRTRTGLGAGSLAGPGGAQLMRRVHSGAIDMAQAQRTMQQRQALQKAFGSDWRQKVYGDRGYAQRTRRALTKNPQNPMLAALNQKLLERRKKMLAAADAKLTGEGQE